MAEPASGRGMVSSDLQQLALEGIQFRAWCGSAFVGDVHQIVLDPRSAPLRQSASNCRQTSSMRRAKLISKPLRLWLGRSLIDLNRLLVQGPSAATRRNRPERGQTTKTHFQEDVRFACDCDIAFEMRDFACPELFITSPSRTALIDGDRSAARRQESCRSPCGGFDSVRWSPPSIRPDTTVNAHPGRLA